MTPSRLDLAKLSALSGVERQLDRLRLGITEKQIDAAADRLAELTAGGD